MVKVAPAAKIERPGSKAASGAWVTETRQIILFSIVLGTCLHSELNNPFCKRLIVCKNYLKQNLK